MREMHTKGYYVITTLLYVVIIGICSYLNLSFWKMVLVAVIYTLIFENVWYYYYKKHKKK